MQASPEYRDRGDTQTAILDALVERHEEGMTVFELRTSVDASIDTIETALAELKADGLIRVETGSETRLYPDERVLPDADENPDPSFLDAVREKLPF